MRIAIVNQDGHAVDAIRRALALDSRHSVAWVATDGDSAEAACARDLPQLMLVDVVSPRSDGVATIRRIMGRTPCAILLVTGTVNGNVGRVFEALGAGAVDAVSACDLSSQRGAETLLEKVDMIARLTGADTRDARTASAANAAGSDRLVAIGASAGGPSAVAEVLGALERGFGAAIVVVQHIDAQFASTLARWLGDRSALPVRVAREGDAPEPGVALLAGTNDHLVLQTARRLSYTPHPADQVYRPSIDVFFESVVRRWTGPVAGVLLTGMGRDGALGLKAIRDAGGVTIAQDQATCAVYGMPKAAAALDAATHVLPLGEIAGALTTFVATARR